MAAVFTRYVAGENHRGGSVLIMAARRKASLLVEEKNTSLRREKIEAACKCRLRHKARKSFSRHHNHRGNKNRLSLKHQQLARIAIRGNA